MKPTYIKQAEIIVQISEMRLQFNQLIKNLIAALNELEEQQDPPFTNNKKRTNLFLQNKVIRFKKLHTMCKELEALTISLKKTLASTKTLSQKGYLSSRHACGSQTQCNDASLRQKWKSKNEKQAGSKGSKNLENKKSQLRYYNCNKIRHIAKDCKSSEKRESQ